MFWMVADYISFELIVYQQVKSLMKEGIDRTKCLRWKGGTCDPQWRISDGSTCVCVRREAWSPRRALWPSFRRAGPLRAPGWTWTDRVCLWTPALCWPGPSTKTPSLPRCCSVTACSQKKVPELVRQTYCLCVVCYKTLLFHSRSVSFFYG